MSTPWKLNGELILNCNCSVFCPCVISLGKHPPTEGYCHGWAGIEVESGHYGKTDLGGITVGMLLDIPGRMGNGNWTAAIYVDDKATDDQAAALEQILTGQAGGTTGLFTMLVSTYLGMKRLPIKFERDGKKRRLEIAGVLKGEIQPVPGGSAEGDLVVTNSQYWMGPDVTVATATKAKFRDFGRVWDLSGKSAEMLKIEWAGP